MKRKELDSLQALRNLQRLETLFKLFALEPARGYFDLSPLLAARMRPVCVLVGFCRPWLTACLIVTIMTVADIGHLVSSSDRRGFAVGLVSYLSKVTFLHLHLLPRDRRSHADEPCLSMF
jgi:hypothetical protein